MKKIKYFNKELKGEELVLTPLEYKCKDEKFEYWLDVIKKSYGNYGEVTYEDIGDVKTQEEIRAYAINTLIVENKKKDVIISNLAQQINNLNIKLNQIQEVK